ncbi:MAG: cadmium-translocating P-type ATPase [Clostridiales bacterium]|jgi:Cd2+/Zn2+-exporting ATPase|nr:cadmium-translocating P-type ATPase [Clostridiales bacterium]
MKTQLENAQAANYEKSVWLLGLCCTVCAGKIEKRAGELEGVQNARLDFATQKLTITAEEPERLPALIRTAARIAREVEPEIQVSFMEKESEELPAVKMRALDISRFALGAVLFAAGLIFDFASPVKLPLFLLSYLLVGGDVIWRALKNIGRGEVFDENFLMSLASAGAFAIGEYPEGVAVMLFYQVGEAFQRYAVGRSRKSIAALMDIRPDFANLMPASQTDGGQTVRVSPEEVSVGDFIAVKPGEKIPLDGVVREGRSTLDVSALTGESLPKDAAPGMEVLSGSINQNGLLTIEVTKEFGESTVSKILRLTREASGRKAQVENFITRFSRYYTPAVVFAALALATLPPLLLPGARFTDWLSRALVFLVVSCPCALVISIPLSFFGGIGGASRRGVLVKGGNFLDAMAGADTVVFDKTGVLTQGVFRVTKITAAGCTEEELLRYAAHAESHSSHPIAVSIQKAYGRTISAEKITAYEEIAGLGVRVAADGKMVLAGNGKLMEAEGIAYTKPDGPGTVVYVAIDSAFAGSLLISDEVKPDAKKAVAALRAIGIRHIAMFTGDTRAVAEKIGRELGLDDVRAELLPHQKVEELEKLETSKNSGNIIFVGDGINDAPVLARADVGAAMGGIASDAAMEAADVALMNDEPSKIVDAILIAKKTRRIVWQNIGFALGVKAIILALGALGLATMWGAVFGDVGVAMIAILNAMRAMHA